VSTFALAARWDEWGLITFLVSASLVIYSLTIYPLLLGWMARKAGRPVRKRFTPRTVSVLIAVHNGERWIERKLASVLSLDYPRELLEVIVISDGSVDGTDEKVRGFAARGPVRLVRIGQAGKAMALNAGLAVARHDILLFTDVRQELEPGGLRKLVACFDDPAVGVVSGDLIIRGSSSSGEETVGLYRRYESWIRDRLGEVDSLFGATGAYYAMRRELAAPLPRNCLLDDMHQPLAAFVRGYRLIMELDAQAFDVPTGLNAEFSRKVRTLAGNYQILGAYPEMLWPTILGGGNRLWFHFFSYKISRLLLPFALLAVAISSFWLPAPWQSIVLLVQGLFYGLAAADPLFPQGARAKMVTAAPRAFVVMMAAAFCAPFVLFIGRERIWRPTQLEPSIGGPSDDNPLRQGRHPR
jgi:biofilm PGA synthesis N-glycosyltransferase PgaC